MKPDRSIENLHPLMRQPVRDLLAVLHPIRWTGAGDVPYMWALFEGYRSPEQQHYLFTETRNTHADAWHSAHQFGMAVDIVGCTVDAQGNPTLDGWSWATENPWPKMHFHAIKSGLTAPLAWDQAHVELPAWQTFRSLHIG